MRIVRGVVTSSLVGAPRAVEASVEELLTFSVKEQQEYLQLPLYSESEFPSGFIPRVLRHIRSLGCEVKVEDARPAVAGPVLSELDNLLIPLRDDQRPVVEKLLSKDQGTLKGVTGSGKGNMVSAVVACFMPTGARIGVFAPTNALITDLCQRIKSVTGTEPGEFTSARTTLRKVTVFSPDKLNALRKDDQAKFTEILSKLDVVLFDESHAFASRTRVKILKACTNAKYRYGFSATPEERMDGYHVLTIGYLGPVVAELGYEQLVAEKRIAKANVKMVIHHHPSPVERNSYTHFYKANIQNNKDRNKLLCLLVEEAEKPVALYITYLNHGRILHDLLKRKLNVALAVGQTPEKVRQKIIKDTRAGRVDVIIASRIFDTGIDIPNLNTVIVADCGVSSTKSRQKAGRGMRLAEGKSEFTIFDVYDHGFKGKDGKPRAFERQAVDRLRTYGETGFDIELYTYEEELGLVPHQT